MDGNVLKHLEFIQNTINRMSTNSFIIKGWAITLVGIILGLNKFEENYLFESHYNFPIEMLIILILIILFWFTNAYFLQQERRFIYIYSKTIEQFSNCETEGKINLTLSMNYADYNTSKSSKYKKTGIILFSILSIVLGFILFLYFDQIFFKIISIISLKLSSLFAVTYVIHTKYLCHYWTCVIGRTIISIYGTMIILLLLINHSMFN